MNDDFKNKMIELSKKINIDITDEQLEKFYRYMELLLEWNEKINLTAITETDEVILKHFIDSMTVFKYLVESKNIIDVGTGAGFPGIPVAITNDNVKITLLDSLNKRINFLNEVCRELNINNVETIHGRAEEAGQSKQHREKYDVVVSRAVANLPVLLEYVSPYVKVGGYSIVMKGDSVDEEITLAQNALKTLNLKVDEKINYSYVVNDEEYNRSILKIKKTNNTPAKYPRNYGQIKKKPL